MKLSIKNLVKHLIIFSRLPRRNTKYELGRDSTRYIPIVGNVLFSYVVGAYKIDITNDNGETIYVATPLIDKHIFDSIESRLDDIIALMRKGNDIGDVLVEVIGIDRSNVAEAIYALRSVTGYGKLQIFLDDPYITDISIVGPGHVWVKHSWVEQKIPEVDFIRTNIVLESFDEVVKLQQLIATKCGTYISTSNPIVDTALPPKDGGHRVHMVAYTISTSRRPEIVIRKKMPNPPSIYHMVNQGVLPKAVADLFKVLIRARGSMIIAGPPGSGKTTLLRSLLYSFVPPGWKVAIIEDTGEIDPPPGSSWVRYTTFELGVVKIDLFDLAKAALRSSATKIIVVGETRGEEAKVLVNALLAGLGGYSTFHGSSPEEVITRFTGPPINLSPVQVAMFNFIAIMGYGEKPKRQLKRLVELIYNAEKGYMDFNIVWDREKDGLNISFEELVKRIRRWSELRIKTEIPIEQILNTGDVLS